MTIPLTDQRLDEIAARAESIREYADLPDGLAGQDVPALIDEIRRLRAQNIADRAGLRDRIRRAVCEAEGFAWDTDMLEPDEYGEIADTVLAVLPAPADRNDDAELRRLRSRVAELETYANGCDAEGCVMPHSSWCERAIQAASENDGCTCGQPGTGRPQPHAMHCWTVSPPRNEVEEMRRALASAAPSVDRATVLRDAAEAQPTRQTSPVAEELPAAPASVLPAPTARAAVERVRAVLEMEAVVGRSALEYRGLIASALMAAEEQR